MEFASKQGIYNQNDILQAEKELVSSTRMVDYTIHVFRKLHLEKAIPLYKQRRKKALGEYKSVQENSSAIGVILGNAHLAEQTTNSGHYSHLAEHLSVAYNFRSDMIDVIYDYSKIFYDCGNYDTASQHFNLHSVLIASSDKNYKSGLWGNLASNILLHQWDVAIQTFEMLKTILDKDPFPNALETLHQGIWLIHWGLYLYYNHSKGKEFLTGLHANDAQYLNVVQMTCPHIIRYWATAVIIFNHHQSIGMKQLVAVIQQEAYKYSDPITEIVMCLHVKFDFDAAQRKVKECESVISNDFFP